MMEEGVPVIHDVLVIGGGPCGLGVASRLCEHSPSALFTEDEHQRWHWMNKHGKKMSLKNRKNGNVSMPKEAGCQGHRYSTLVLDASGETFMSRWRTLFTAFDIHHLRSPMFWHVDPTDRDALLAMAHNHDREKDLLELKNCVGKEVSKHLRRTRAKKRPPMVDVDERDRKDYFTPPTDLFLEHCQEIADRYGLCGDILQKETVEEIEYRQSGEDPAARKLFTVKTDKGVHHARVVVLAVGPGNKPQLPRIPGIMCEDAATPPPHVCHAMHIKEFPANVVQERIQAKKPTNVLVIGGGLTSAQLSDLAVRKGVTKVWHLMRGPCKVKFFDVDLSWMGKFRNVEQAYFHGADSDEERMDLILKARNGGSITPIYNKKLKKHIAAGRVELRTFTSVVGAEFNAEDGKWSVQTEPTIPEMPAIDHIYFATGIQSNFFDLPYLQTMLKEHPLKNHQGLPGITEDLMWDHDVPFFISGRFAGLQLGPAAGNLGGARIGAERISWGIEDYLKGESTADKDAESIDEELQYVTGRGNKFASLSLDVGDDE